MGLLDFALSVTAISFLQFFAGKTEGAERTGCWTPLINAHTCADDASTAITWAAPHNQLFLKENKTETSFHKKIFKRNLARVGMVRCMNVLADKV